MEDLLKGITRVPRYDVGKWINEQETSESLNTNPNSKDTTTTEKDKIRQARLLYFLPNLEKEFPIFKKHYKKIIVTNKILNICEKLKYLTKLITFCLIGFLEMNFIKIYYNNVADSHNYCISHLLPHLECTKLVSVICHIGLILYLWVGVFLLIFLPLKLIKKLPYLIGFKDIKALFWNKSKQDKNLKINTFIRGNNIPYMEAFLFANGFVVSEKYEGYDNFILHIPKELAYASFQDFLNFMKTNFEPHKSTYLEKDNDSYCTFDCIFYYMNEDDLLKNRESRIQVYNELISHAPRKKNYFNFSYENSNVSYASPPTSYGKVKHRHVRQFKAKKYTVEDAIRDTMVETIVTELLKK